MGEEAFINGRFGFYNYSQAQVRYSGFVQEFTAPPPAPALTALDPAETGLGETSTITFEGTNLLTAYEIISDNTGIKGRISGFTSDGYLLARVETDPGATTGPTTLGLTTFGGTASLAFSVELQQQPPVITGIVPDHGVQGQTIAAQIQGSEDGNRDNTRWHSYRIFPGVRKGHRPDT